MKKEETKQELETEQKPLTEAKFNELNRKIKILVKREKGILKRRYKVTVFKQPVLHLIMRNNEVKTYEGVTGSKWAYMDSDGREQTVDLRPTKLLTFPYGNDYYRGYIHYEREIEPYPFNPGIQAATLQLLFEQAQYQESARDVEKINAQTGKWVKIIKALGVILAIAGGIYIIWTIVGKPDEAVRIVQQVPMTTVVG